METAIYKELQKGIITSMLTSALASGVIVCGPQRIILLLNTDLTF
jgi:hypothetical protein